MKTTNMSFVVIIVVSVLFGPPMMISCITVSPDLGLRNTTRTHTEERILEEIIIDKVFESNDSLADRNRRLIPYMTFYMPNEFASNQHINFIPEQQQKPIGYYQSQFHQTKGRVAEHQQPNHFQIRYPTQKPKYQAILYGTRHQIAGQGKDTVHHQLHPLSYKETNIRPMHQQLSTTKVNYTPFSTSNKIPGPFTPIIYVHPTDNLNYNKKPQSNRATLQYNDVLNEQQSYQQQEEQQQSGIHSPISHTTPSPKLSILVSPRPFYPLLTDIQNHQNRPDPQVLIQSQQSEREQQLMTPQQKYVEYLKEQLRYKQQQYYHQKQQQQQQHQPQYQQYQEQHQQQQHPQQQQYQEQHQQQEEPTYIINASPSPPITNNIISYEKPVQSPVAYQHPTGPSGEDVNESYRPSPTPISYDPPTSPQPYHYKHSPTRRPPTHYPNYVDIIIPESQRIVNIPQPPPPPQKQPSYVTTSAPPIIIPLGQPMYGHPKDDNDDDDEEQEELKDERRFRPMNPPIVQSPAPIEIPRPIKPKQQSIYKGPQYLPQPTLVPQTIRQHLTETTRAPIATLTTYHPNLVSQKPKYSTGIPVPRPYNPPKLPPNFKSIYSSKPIAETLSRSKPIEKQENYSNITSTSLADILHKLQESNELPMTFTPDNIDNSIRTLIKILNNLKQSQTIVENPPQHHEDDYSDYDNVPEVDPSHPGPNSGRPGIDYPALAEIPHTNFNCKEQRYKGFFGDPETNCQVWHYCDLNGGQASFLCPNGTIFSQVALTCDWWFNVKCSSTAQLYVLNERLYKYILPLTPKFPEDYSGPLVDKYLALKFKEMEEKMNREKTKGKPKTEEEDGNSASDDDEEEESGSSEDQVEAEKEDNTNIIKDHKEDTVMVTTIAQNSENIESKSEEELDDSHEKNQTPIYVTTTTPLVPSLQSMPIVVTSTEESYSPTPPPNSIKTHVESEKVEVIEIKTDGTSGRLIPPRLFNSGLKK